MVTRVSVMVTGVIVVARFIEYLSITLETSTSRCKEEKHKLVQC